MIKNWNKNCRVREKMLNMCGWYIKKIFQKLMYIKSSYSDKAEKWQLYIIYLNLFEVHRDIQNHTKIIQKSIQYKCLLLAQKVFFKTK